MAQRYDQKDKSGGVNQEGAEGQGRAPVKELVPGKIYLFSLNILYMEDIVLDMRDRIVRAL